MKKILYFVLSVFVAVNVFALDEIIDSGIDNQIGNEIENHFENQINVNRDELKKAEDAAIEFENYGGPWAQIDSVQAIRGIGTNLGDIVAQNPAASTIVNPEAKYTMIHALGGLDQNGTQKLSADILLLNSNAGVDHIRNLRLIISGYLEAAYNYDRSDAEILAIFITVYNAVYRDKFENFSENYSEEVLKNLSPEKAGLSTNWENWAGNSQIVIPLGEFIDGISPVETSTISDDNVIEAIRNDESMGIEEREKLVEIKDRESTSATEKARAAQKDATQQRKQGNTQKAEQSARTSSAQQKIADRKSTESKKEKSAISKDKKTVAEKKEKEKEEKIAAAQPDNVNEVTGLFLVDEKTPLYRLVTVNADTGKVVRKSPVNQVRSHVVYAVDNVTITDANGTETYPLLYIAVCGVNNGKSAVRLCLIDPVSLEIKKQSQELIADGAEFIQLSGDFVTVIDDGKNCYAAIYDKSLNLKCKSSVAVKGATPLNLNTHGFLVTDSSGNPLLLNPSNLSDVWAEKPERKTNVNKK